MFDAREEHAIRLMAAGHALPATVARKAWAMMSEENRAVLLRMANASIASIHFACDHARLDELCRVVEAAARRAPR